MKMSKNEHPNNLFIIKYSFVNEKYYNNIRL
jgi:hypothetical protein